MGRKRTTDCKQTHTSAPCRDCNRIRVARWRKDHPTAPRLAPTTRQRLTENARRYVRTALARGAIAPPDACERCEVPVQAAPSWPVRALHFFHPDPRQGRAVAWLCTDCYRRVRATREPLTLTWTWPGITAPRSRKSPQLAGHVAVALAALATMAGGPATSTTLREAAFVRLLLRTLTIGERERLYAAGVLAGPEWRPTVEAGVDRVLREWAFEERAERGATAREAGGTTLIPLPPEARRRALPPEKPAAPPPRAAFDREAAFAQLDRVDGELAAAVDEATATIERVALALRDRLG